MLGGGDKALAATPTTPGAFRLDPSRLLDTRVGNGAAQAPAASGTVGLQVTGRGGVPSGVAAVVVNVTVTAGPSGRVHHGLPVRDTQPTASNLNYTAGQTIPNLVTVKVGSDGKIDLNNNSAGSVHLIADVAGYYLAGTPTVPGAFVSLAPARVLDTRVGNGAPNAAVAAHGTVDLQVTGRGGVPAEGVAAVVVNVTVTGPSKGGYITVYPRRRPADCVEPELHRRADHPEPGHGQGRSRREGRPHQQLSRHHPPDRRRRRLLPGRHAHRARSVRQRRPVAGCWTPESATVHRAGAPWPAPADEPAGHRPWRCARPGWPRW